MGMKKAFRFIGVLTLALGLVAGGVGLAAAEKGSITVGGKNFTEQYILPQLAKELLEKAGYDVTLKTGVGTVIARKSLLNEQIDLYYEYTGTAYTVFYKKGDQKIMSDPEKVYQWVKKHDAEKGLVWLDPVQFNNTYTIMMRKDQSKKLGIKSLSDFADYVKANPDKLTMALGAEFWERPDGFKRMMKVYDFSMPAGNIKKMEIGLTYMALKNGQVDAAMGFATDGRIAAFGFVNLEDDKQFFPVYNPAPVVRKAVLDKHPDIAEVLRPLAQALTTEKMQRLNMLVDVEHKDVARVAKQFLKDEGLL
jgi:osmoprotectant transport system substrate-binding protein